MGTRLPRRQPIRLPTKLYHDPNRICSITICTRAGRPVFADANFARTCVTLLGRQASKTRIKLYAYTFMPDHVHLLLAPSLDCSIPAFVRRFKSLATKLARRQWGRRESFWQKRYYGHFLRQDEDARKAAMYVLANPARSGLVKDWREYPFSGSLVFQL